jgi:hypothetical protein
MPLVATRGAASAQGFGEFSQPAAPIYIEDVFSTWLYTGNGSTQTITNGIDLSGKGGLVWTKQRNTINGGASSLSHYLLDTVRGGTNALFSNNTNAQAASQRITFGSTGYTLDGTSSGDINFEGSPPATFCSWTFREQAKFFDVVTYTGNGANRTIAHSLGSVPGMIIVKRTDTTGDWQVYHRSLANTQYLVLNSTAAVATGATRWNSTTPTASVFSLGTDATVNASGGTYVAYIYAHNAGGFGLSGNDNVISCGSLSASTLTTVNLGYEPQYVIYKVSSGTTGNWGVFDVMRGMALTSGAFLVPNTNGAEVSSQGIIPTATGFQFNGNALGYTTGETIIYMAIRRPMKVPTTGTSVFSPVIKNASANSVVTTGFPVDLSISAQRSKVENEGTNVIDRLRGSSTTTAPTLQTNRDVAEYVWTSNGFGLDNNTALVDNLYNPVFGVTSSVVYWNFRRASGFFDVVCYTGTGPPGQTITHNLGVAPELIIIKARNTTGNFWTFTEFTPTERTLLKINLTDAGTVSAYPSVFVSAPTSTSFQLADNANFNGSGTTYIAYLFATCAGVSKVGSYTGTGATQTINAGLPAGARFVLIKRTDSTGSWWVWDTARGMVAGTDPRLALNSTAAEVNNNWVYTVSTGFQIVTADSAVNSSGGSYIYLAIA